MNLEVIAMKLSRREILLSTKLQNTNEICENILETYKNEDLIERANKFEFYLDIYENKAKQLWDLGARVDSCIADADILEVASKEEKKNWIEEVKTLILGFYNFTMPSTKAHKPRAWAAASKETKISFPIEKFTGKNKITSYCEALIFWYEFQILKFEYVQSTVLHSKNPEIVAKKKSRFDQAVLENKELWNNKINITEVTEATEEVESKSKATKFNVDPKQYDDPVIVPTIASHSFDKVTDFLATDDYTILLQQERGNEFKTKLMETLATLRDGIELIERYSTKLERSEHKFVEQIVKIHKLTRGGKNDKSTATKIVQHYLQEYDVVAYSTESVCYVLNNLISDMAILLLTGLEGIISEIKPNAITDKTTNLPEPAAIAKIKTENQFVPTAKISTPSQEIKIAKSLKHNGLSYKLIGSEHDGYNLENTKGILYQFVQVKEVSGIKLYYGYQKLTRIRNNNCANRNRKTKSTAKSTSTRKLKDIKSKVYSLLGDNISDTKSLKSWAKSANFTLADLRSKSAWLAIESHLMTSV